MAYSTLFHFLLINFYQGSSSSYTLNQSKKGATVLMMYKMNGCISKQAYILAITQVVQQKKIRQPFTIYIMSIDGGTSFYRTI